MLRSIQGDDDSGFYGGGGGGGSSAPSNPYNGAPAGMPSGPGTCGPGERWDDISQSCIDDGSGGTSPGDGNSDGGGSNPGEGNPQNCPPGQHRDGSPNNTCVPDGTDTHCPDGQEFVNSVQGCRPKCGAGKTHDINGNCIEFDDPTPASSGGPAGNTGSGNTPGTSGHPGTYQTTPFHPPPAYEWSQWNAPAQTPFEMNLQSELEGFLGDWDTRVPFTPGVVQNMKTSAFKNSFGRTNADKNAIEADAIQRGGYVSSHTGDRLANARRGYGSDFSDASRQIDTDAAVQNYTAQYQNRVAALDRAQQFVDQQRNFLLQSQMNDFERQRGMADVAIAYYQLEQQRWQAENQFNLTRYGIDSGANTSLQLGVLQGIQGL